MLEKWKTYKNNYEVSNYGRVRNKITKEFKKPSKRFDGYYQVILYFNGKRQQWPLHRLVATVWLRALKKNEDVHHKNKLPCCNCLSNLQIKDQKQHVVEHKVGSKLSQQTKNKISNSHKGKKRAPFSQQWKRKMSESTKKYWQNKKKVINI